MKTKIFYLILFINLINIRAFSQCDSIVAQKAIGNTGDDFLADMYLARDSGWVLGGSSNSPLGREKTQGSRGGFDYWVVKLNRDLARKQYKQWDKTIGGSGDDRLTSLQQTLDGGYILGGYSNSGISGEKTQSSRGGYDYWIVKLDINGNKQWDKTIGGSGTDLLKSLQQTSDGGYILGGQSTSNISGEKSQNSRGLSDYWIVKIDNNGNKQWDMTIGGSGTEIFTALQQTTEGGYILGGSSNSGISGEKTQTARGSYDYWVVKTDNLGHKQWDKTVGGTLRDTLRCLQQAEGGGYILGGGSESPISGDKTQGSRGGFDYWLVKLTERGAKLWDKTIGGTGADVLRSFQQTQATGYLLGGYSSSNISGEKGQNSWGLSDYWILRLGFGGPPGILWSLTIGGGANDYLIFISQFKGNVIVAGGYSYSSNAAGCKTNESRGSADYWIVVVKTHDHSASGIIASASNTNPANAVLNKSKEFRIYPVPAKNMLHVQGNANAIYSLTDMSGKVLLTKNIAGNGTIDLSQLPAGMYYLKNNETGAIQKVVVSK